jgi:hypothetical protein
MLTRSRQDALLTTTSTTTVSIENSSSFEEKSVTEAVVSEAVVSEAVLIVCLSDVLCLYSHCVFREGSSLLDGVRFTPKGRRCTVEHFNQASQLLNRAINVNSTS